MGSQGSEPSEHDGDGEDGHSHSDDSDGDDDDDAFAGRRPAHAGRAAATGSGTFGGGGPSRLYGGTRSAQWRFGTRSAGPSAPLGQGVTLSGAAAPSIGPSGDMLRNGVASTVAAATGSDQQRLAREARLAALEQRGLGQTLGGTPAQAPPPAASTPGITAPPLPTAAATASSAPVVGSKKQKDAEREEIKRRIAEEREERAARFGHPTPAPAARAEGSVTQPAEGSKPDGAGVTKREVRVPGQLGMGPSKAQRAVERERILRDMEEDRKSRLDRNVPVSQAVSASLPPAAAAVGSTNGGVVRLQIRCAASGRTVTTTAFTASSVLSEVRCFAASELGLLIDSTEFALTFPPRTTFATPEQFATSLGDLGLSPSATLLAKGQLEHVPEEDGTESAAAAAAELPRLCPMGHRMEKLAAQEEIWCDRCKEGIEAGADAWECKECDYFECRACGVVPDD